jgi:hypothetical protein
MGGGLRGEGEVGGAGRCMAERSLGRPFAVRLLPRE